MARASGRCSRVRSSNREGAEPYSHLPMGYDSCLPDTETYFEMAAKRHPTVPVVVGHVTIGGDAPVVVQSMTNTDTADVEATVAQVAELARAGSELVRITVNNEAAARAVPAIRERLDAMGVNVPLVGDFHFNGARLLENYAECAQALAKYRINPGNVGSGETRDAQFAAMIEKAIEHGKAVRIGVNWGSLDKQLVARMMDENARAAEPLEADAMTREIMVASALESAARAEALGLGRDRIVLSCKMSGVQDLIAVYEMLASRSDYALHLGLTEAGMGTKGVVASTAALAVLLQQGIGDTIRVSLTPEPGGDRTTDPPGHGVARVYAPGDRLSRLRPHHQHLFPAAGARHPGLSRRQHAALAHPVSRRGDPERGGDGMRGERPRREPPRRHRHQPARYRRAAGRTGLRGRREEGDAERGGDCRRVPGDRGGVRAAALRVRVGEAFPLRIARCSARGRASCIAR